MADLLMSCGRCDFKETLIFFDTMKNPARVVALRHRRDQCGPIKWVLKDGNEVLRAGKFRPKGANR